MSRKSVTKIISEMEEKSSPAGTPKGTPTATPANSPNRPQKRWSSKESFQSLGTENEETDLKTNHVDEDDYDSRTLDDGTIVHSQEDEEYSLTSRNIERAQKFYNMKSASIAAIHTAMTSNTIPGTAVAEKAEEILQQQDAANEKEEEIIAAYKKRLQEDDRTVIFEMFELLLLKINQVQNKLNSIEIEQAEIEEKQDRLSEVSRNQSEFNTAATQEVNAIAENLFNVMEVVIKTEREVESINRRMEKIEVKMCKGSLMVYELDDAKDDNPRSSAKTFLTDYLELSFIPEIQTAYRLGKWTGKCRPLFIKLLDPNDTAYIFENVSNLKGKKSKADKYIRVTEQTTEKEAEKKKRQREIKQENRRLPISHAAELEVKKGEIYIDGTKYIKQVDPPAARRVLLAAEQEKQQYRGVNINKGGEETKDGSKFTSYTAEAETFEDIKLAYKLIKEENLSATHIMCGYRIYGKELHILQDFSDDGEWGGGRRILEVLKKQGAFNIAVFVVRMHDGPNLGKERFEIIQRVAENALSKVKRTLNYGQRCSDRSLLQALKKAATQPPKDVRKSQRIASARNKSGSSVEQS